MQRVKDQRFLYRRGYFAALIDDTEPDRLTYMTLPKEHRVKLHSTNPIKRLNGEIKRRTTVVGIFPNEVAIARLIGAILMEQSDQWAVQRTRYMTLETHAPVIDNPIIMIRHSREHGATPRLCHRPGTPSFSLGAQRRMELGAQKRALGTLEVSAPG